MDGWKFCCQQFYSQKRNLEQNPQNTGITRCIVSGKGWILFASSQSIWLLWANLCASVPTCVSVHRALRLQTSPVKACLRYSAQTRELNTTMHYPRASPVNCFPHMPSHPNFHLLQYSSINPFTNPIISSLLYGVAHTDCCSTLLNNWPVERL